MNTKIDFETIAVDDAIEHVPQRRPQSNWKRLFDRLDKVGKSAAVPREFSARLRSAVSAQNKREQNRNSNTKFLVGIDKSGSVRVWRVE